MFNDLVLTKKTLKRIRKKPSYLNWPSELRGKPPIIFPAWSRYPVIAMVIESQETSTLMCAYS